MKRIELKHKENISDARENKILTIIEEDTGIKLPFVKIVDVYNIFEKLNNEELIDLKDNLFCDPVFQEGEIGFYFAKNIEFDFCIEISYKPGVTDNVGKTAARGISDILKRKIQGRSVRSSILYLFKGNLSKEKQITIAKKVLCNVLIEDFVLLKKKDVENGKEILYSPSEDIERTKPYYKTINLNVSDKELLQISDEGVLSLSLEEMKAIQSHYNEEATQKIRSEKNIPLSPTDVELEVFAQTWSEHCKHKIFSSTIEYNDGKNIKTINSLFKTYIQQSAYEIKENRDDLLSLFVDNAGIVKLNEKYAYCVKVETHNSPSALDPYGGAMTGIVGVNRDIIGTGMGAYPIFNTDIFCFGSPYTDAKDIPEGLQHPRRIFRGVHRGIKDGGNESGIPTINGSITFDNSFLGKPLVFCGTGGIMPLKIAGKDSYKKYIKKGDIIVMCGGRIGKDGIHGATFSSAHLSDSSPTSAVQIGDPITQKKMLDFLMEARDKGLYSGLTDNGAGGLSSSIGEMAEFTNGAILHLDKCPLKYAGLKPWEILVSEAQERMSVAVPDEFVEEFLTLSKKRGVESTVIGEFTDHGYFECDYKGETVSFIDMKMLHEGLPKMHLKANWQPVNENSIDLIDDNLSQSLKDILARPNVASKEHWVRMYDHEVGGRTIGKPFMGKDNDGPSDGGVLKVFPDTNEGLVVTHGLIPRYSAIDTYQMAACAIDEAFRSAVILGADPEKITGLDNFCWPDPVKSDYTPDGEYKLAQLVRACEAVYDVTKEYNCPCISGKDSMKNDYKSGGKKISVLPTLLFTCTGKINDITKMTTSYFKDAGDLIYLLGDTFNHLGKSEYYEMKDIQGGVVPRVNPKKAKQLYKAIYRLVQEGILKSAHDLSDGGLIVALSESAFAGNLGATINTDAIGENLSIESKLFSETPSRILVSISSINVNKFLKILEDEVVLYLGKTEANDAIEVTSFGKVILKEKPGELKSIWHNALVF